MPMEEAVGLLAKFAPAALAELRSRFPDSAALLRPGQLAGETQERRNLAAEVTIAACDRVSQLASELASFLKGKLEISSRLEYLTQFLSLLASGSLLGLLSTGAPVLAKYLVAALAFVSSIASLAAKYFSRTLTAGAASAPEIFAELLEIKPAAEALRNDVRLWILDNDASRADDIRALVAKGNELSGRVYRLAHVVPGFVTAATV